MAKDKTTATTATGGVTVRFLQGMAAMDNNRNKGDVLTVGAAEADRLIEKGLAVAVAPGTRPRKADAEDGAE